MEPTQVAQEIKVATVDSLLSFRLDKEIFAVNVTKVIEIMEVPRISKLPRAQKYMMGVINVRGTVLPLIDTRVKMGMEPIFFGVNTCAIIIEIEKGDQIVHLGILVDAVLEVLEVSEDDVQPTPSMEQEIYADFIKGILTRENDFVLILDLDGLFSKEEIRQIKVAGDMGESNIVTKEKNVLTKTFEKQVQAKIKPKPVPEKTKKKTPSKGGAAKKTK